MNSAAKAIISSNHMARVVPPAPVATAGFQSLRRLGKWDTGCGWLDMKISFLQNRGGAGYLKQLAARLFDRILLIVVLSQFTLCRINDAVQVHENQCLNKMGARVQRPRPRCSFSNLITARVISAYALSRVQGFPLCIC
jgi:hypothetical protein